MWEFESFGIFSVKFARKHIDDHTLPVGGTVTRWNMCVPIKVNIFLCCFMLNMLHLWMNLVGEWTWNRLYPCQAETENITHLFFFFPLASQLWNYISLWPDLQVPCFYMPSEMFCCIDALPVIRMERISVESVFKTTIRCFGRIGMWLSFGPQNIENSLSLIILLIFLFVGLFFETQSLGSLGVIG